MINNVLVINSSYIFIVESPGGCKGVPVKNACAGQPMNSRTRYSCEI